MHVEIAEPNAEGRGEIVVTCLDSFAFPIIRYRTGDIGTLDPTPCPCGRGLPKLLNVDGRRTDFLVTPQGRVLHALSVIYVLRDLPMAKEFRVIQESIDNVVIHLVADRPLTTTEKEGVHRRFEILLGSDVQVTLLEVPALPRSPSGKFRYVESRISERLLSELMKGNN
jgi:phenylacetate-CoA ligase